MKHFDALVVGLAGVNVALRHDARTGMSRAEEVDAAGIDMALGQNDEADRAAARLFEAALVNRRLDAETRIDEDVTVARRYQVRVARALRHEDEIADGGGALVAPPGYRASRDARLRAAISSGLIEAALAAIVQ